MSAVVSDPPLTLEAHMMWEAQQRERHEFVAGEMYAIVGARVTHDTIALNIAVALRDVLPDTSGRVFISDMPLHVASVDASFYPDVFVRCDSRD